MILSVTPGNSATNVATNSPIVFVFDQDMNTTVAPLASIPAALIGNFEIEPPKLTVSGSWGTDKRTLTLKCTKAWPFATNISWTLNPPTNGTLPSFSPFASVSNQILATVSGSFTTAPPPPPPPPVPKLISITPTNGAAEVSPNSAVVFVFDQEMDTTTPLQTNVPPSFIGNYQFAYFFDNTPFAGFWGADKRTLTFESMDPVPTSTTVLWKLNQTGTTVPLKSSLGQPLAATNGSFTIVTNTGGDSAEICQTTPAGYGFYLLTKTIAYRQLATNNLISDPDSPPSLNAVLEDPALVKNDPARITNGSITLPSSALLTFTNQFSVVLTNRGGGITTNGTGNLGLFDLRPSESALESAYPPGTYTIRIDPEREPEQVIPMDLPATPASIPTISNFGELLSVDAGQDFMIRWNPFTPQGPGAFVQLTITDVFGKLIFQAPNPCVSRPLDPSATSVVIPANTFRPGLSYYATLQFGFEFYNSTNDVPRMAGNGAVFRSTFFELNSIGGTSARPATMPATFTLERLPSAAQPELILSGTPGKMYTIQRAASLTNPNWVPAGFVLMNASGNAVFDETNGAVQFPSFYRAAGN